MVKKKTKQGRDEIKQGRIIHTVIVQKIYRAGIIILESEQNLWFSASAESDVKVTLVT